MAENFGAKSTRLYLMSANGTEPRGGVERVVKLLADDLCSHNYDVVIVDSQKLLPGWLGNSRLTQYVFPVVASIWLWYKRATAAPFVTISNSFFTPFFSADVLIVHGSAAGYIKALTGSGKRFFGMHILSVLERRSMRRARHNACVSEAVRDLAVNLYGVPREKCSVIYNGINAAIFKGQPKFVEQTVRLGFAGRFEYGKGAPYLTELAKWISGQPNLHLVLAVIGPVPAALHGLKNISILQDLGPEDMAAFYDKIDIFLLPSLFEGFELVTLEAIASGVCVVGNRVGACGVFLDQGVVWVRQLPDTPDEFIQSAPALFSDLRASHDPLAMHDFIQQSFSTERFCKEVRTVMSSRI